MDKCRLEQVKQNTACSLHRPELLVNKVQIYTVNTVAHYNNFSSR